MRYLIIVALLFGCVAYDGQFYPESGQGSAQTNAKTDDNYIFRNIIFFQNLTPSPSGRGLG